MTSPSCPSSLRTTGKFHPGETLYEGRYLTHQIEKLIQFFFLAKVGLQSVYHAWFIGGKKIYNKKNKIVFVWKPKKRKSNEAARDKVPVHINCTDKAMVTMTSSDSIISSKSTTSSSTHLSTVQLKILLEASFYSNFCFFGFLLLNTDMRAGTKRPQELLHNRWICNFEIRVYSFRVCKRNERKHYLG